MQKLDQLTAEQQAMLPGIRDEWLRCGLSTEPANRQLAEEGVREAYRAAGLEPPALMIWLDSPMAGAYGQAILQTIPMPKAQVWAQVGDQVGAQVNRSAYGSSDMGWVAWFKAMQAIGVTLPAAAETIAAVSEQVGWWWPFENAVIATERPRIIKFDGEKRLHCETGPAIEYADGFAIYAWRGIKIPKEWIEQGPPKAADALKIRDMEQRRIACEMLGWHNVLPFLPNAKLIDRNDNPQVGELWQGDLPDHGTERFLQVQCGTGRTFAIPVGMQYATAREANAATYGIAPQILDNVQFRT